MIASNQIVRDLLSNMHKDKDTNDVDKAKVKKYTFSIKSEKDLREKIAHEELMFKNLSLLEDFVRPGSPVTPRTTGYEHGHIRSLMKLDTYGPSGSRVNTGDRESGRLPSPNVDRYVRVSPNHKLTFRGDLMSAGSSRTSTSQSSRSPPSSPGDGTINSRDNPSISMHSLFHSSSKPSSALDLTIPSSLKGELRGTLPKRITDEDRFMLDPLVRRKKWHHTYVQQAKVNYYSTCLLFFRR
jgi:hypothetical protein